jgi:hypothetical protein
MNNFDYRNDLPQVLSMGWGVQTVAMLIMVENGTLPKPDIIIHSDTGAEKPETHYWKNKFGIPIIEKLGIPYVEVMHEGGIVEGYMKKSTIPIVGFRSCTTNYKVNPILRYLKKLYKKPKESKQKKPYWQTWIGISTDESRRKIEREDQSPKYQEMIYPFLDLNLSRKDLSNIIKKSGYEEPVKSGCFMCPYAGLRGFLELKEKHPDLFDIAIKMENKYFEKFPERHNGFIASSKTKLQTLKEMKSLFSYTEIENEQNECDSGGCFL